MEDWEYIPFRIAKAKNLEINEIADEFGLNRSTTMRVLVNYALKRKNTLQMRAMFQDTRDNQAGSGVCGAVRKDKRT